MAESVGPDKVVAKQLAGLGSKAQDYMTIPGDKNYNEQKVATIDVSVDMIKNYGLGMRANMQSEDWRQKVRSGSDMSHMAFTYCLLGWMFNNT